MEQKNLFRALDTFIERKEQENVYPAIEIERFMRSVKNKISRKV